MSIVKKIMDYAYKNGRNERFYFYTDDEIPALTKECSSGLFRRPGFYAEMEKDIPLEYVIEALNQGSICGLRLRHVSQRYARDSQDILRWC